MYVDAPSCRTPRSSARRSPTPNLSFANMLGADLEGVALGHATMNQTVLDQANLRGVELGRGRPHLGLDDRDCSNGVVVGG